MVIRTVSSVLSGLFWLVWGLRGFWWSLPRQVKVRKTKSTKSCLCLSLSGAENHGQKIKHSIKQSSRPTRIKSRVWPWWRHRGLTLSRYASDCLIAYAPRIHSLYYFTLRQSATDVFSPWFSALLKDKYLSRLPGFISFEWVLWLQVPPQYHLFPFLN